MNALGRTIRKVKTEDRDAVLSVLEAAFKRKGEAGLVERLWQEQAIRFERLAEIGGVPVGYCAFTTVTAQPPLEGLLVGLGPLAVAPDHQGQGVGAELVEAGLQICRENNARLIAVLGDPDYYSRFGFEAGAKKKMRWAGFDAGEAFRIIDAGDIEPDEIRVIHYHPAFNAVS